MDTYKQFKQKITAFCKREFDFTGIDFEDTIIKDICETGHRLGSLPYYCSFEIMKHIDNQEKETIK